MKSDSKTTHRDNGQLSCIERVPPELLARVFFFVLELDDPLNWEWNKAKRLGKVCRLFLQIMKSSPILWPKLDAKDGPALGQIIRCRNPTSPLAFVYKELESLDIDFLSSHLTETQTRWTQVVWAGSDWDLIDAALAGLTPMMTQLSLNATRSDLQELRLGDGAPIVSMTLSQVYLPRTICSRVYPLHTLDLHLQLSLSDSRTRFPTIMDGVEGSLKQLRQLVVLHMEIQVQRPIMISDSIGRSSIRLPRLDSLILGGSVAGSRFNLLSRLEVPRCRYLSVGTFELGLANDESNIHSIPSLKAVLLSSGALVLRLGAGNTQRILSIESVSMKDEGPSMQYQGRANLNIAIKSHPMPQKPDRIISFLRSTLRSEAILRFHLWLHVSASEDEWDLINAICHQHPLVHSICLGGDGTSRALQAITSWTRSGDPFLKNLFQITIRPSSNVLEYETTARELNKLRKLRTTLPRADGHPLRPLIITVPKELFNRLEIFEDSVDILDIDDRMQCSCSTFLLPFQ